MEESVSDKSGTEVGETKEKKDTSIKLGFLLVTAGFAIFIISLLILIGEGIPKAYENIPELYIITITILLRIGLMFTFCFIMFKKWFAQEKKYIKNIPFLVGAFYYLSAMGKFLDIITYIYYGSPTFVNEIFLLITKIRFLLLIITFLPMLFLGLRPVIYNYGLNRQWDEKKVLRIRKEIIALYVCVFAFLIIISTTIAYIQIVLAIMSIFTYIFIWYIFRFAHKHNTFPTIRANWVSWGLIFYIISASSRALMTYFLGNILSVAQIYVIGELLDFVSITIIFLGFILKPKK